MSPKIGRRRLLNSLACFPSLESIATVCFVASELNRDGRFCLLESRNTCPQDLTCCMLSSIRQTIASQPTTLGWRFVGNSRLPFLQTRLQTQNLPLVLCLRESRSHPHSIQMNDLLSQNNVRISTSSVAELTMSNGMDISYKGDTVSAISGRALSSDASKSTHTLNLSHSCCLLCIVLKAALSGHEKLGSMSNAAQVCVGDVQSRVMFCS